MSLENPNIIDNLQSHNEIVSKPENLQFLTALESENKRKNHSELIKKNDRLITGMKNVLQQHVDTILAHKDILTDKEAKVLITFDALQDKCLYREMPNNETERNICAKKIANDMQQIKFFDAHETSSNQKYFDVESGNYSNVSTEKTINLSLNEKDISLSTGDAVLDIYVSSHPILKAYMLQKAKQNRIYKISQATDEDDDNKMSPRSQLHQQVEKKRESMRREEYDSSQKFDKEFAMDPSNMMELSQLLAGNNNIDIPTNENSFLLKNLFFGVVARSFETRTRARDFYAGGRDLDWDNGISRDSNGNYIKSQATIRDNNLSLIKQGDNLVAKNSITGISIDITKNLFETSNKNIIESEKDSNLLDTSRQEFDERFINNYMKKHNLTQDQLKDLSEEKRRTIKIENHIAYMSELFTQPNKKHIYNALLQDQFRRQNGPERIGKDEGIEIVNALLIKVSGGAEIGFDVNKSNTTREVIEDQGEKVYIIKQGKSSFKLGFNKVYDVQKDTRTQEQKEQEDNTVQRELLHDDTRSVEDKINTYHPHDRQGDIRRAIFNIDNPKTIDGKKYIDCSDLRLTAKDVMVLSQKLVSNLKNSNGDVQLNLSNNNLENLPKGLFENNKISGINVSNNAIDCLPKLDSGDHSHLKSLDLARNNITSCPNFIEKGIPESLESLDISGNECSDIGPVVQLKKLQHLDVDHVGMNSIPAGFGNLEQLQSFSASNNNLSGQLIRDFAVEPGFSSLQSLYLGGNKLIGVDVSKCQKLKKLSVSGNEGLENFPNLAKNDQGKNEFLESVYCEHTNIKSIPAGINTDTFQNLKDVDIFDRIVSGENAKNRFLDGSLTSAGYAFTPSVQETQAFFDSSSIQCKYSVAESTDKSSALKKARQELGLADMDTSPYALREKNGHVSVYMFAHAEQGKDYV